LNLAPATVKFQIALFVALAPSPGEVLQKERSTSRRDAASVLDSRAPWDTVRLPSRHPESQLFHRIAKAGESHLSAVIPASAKHPKVRRYERAARSQQRHRDCGTGALPMAAPAA